MAFSSTFQKLSHFNHLIKISNARVFHSSFMGENKNQILHGECPRKLNLNVPPLSTRRSSASNKIEKPDATNMVPFSWERIPGEPKDKQTDEIDQIMPPKPPPGWQGGATYQCDDHDDVDCGDKEYCHAIDIFSLADSIEDMESSCKATRDRSSGTQTPNNGYYGSPNFIIQRFLPDAQALAEASVMNNRLPSLSSPCSSSSFSRAVSTRRSHHSIKGCGLGSFLPWKMKHKPCSVRSPVCDTIIGPNLKQKR